MVYQWTNQDEPVEIPGHVILIFSVSRVGLCEAEARTNRVVDVQHGVVLVPGYSPLDDCKHNTYQQKIRHTWISGCKSLLCHDQSGIKNIDTSPEQKAHVRTTSKLKYDRAHGQCLWVKLV